MLDMRSYIDINKYKYKYIGIDIDIDIYACVCVCSKKLCIYCSPRQ